MAFADIIENKNTTAGYVTKMYLVEKSKLTLFPATTAGTKSVDTAFTLEVGAAFVEIPVSNVTGKAVYAQEQVGTSDNPSRDGTLTLYHRGYDATTARQLDDWEGIEVIALIGQRKQCDEDTDIEYQIVGNACAGARVEVSYTNTQPDKGFNIMVKEYSVGSPSVYTAAIPV